jgi:hypothetical protein
MMAAAMAALPLLKTRHSSAPSRAAIFLAQDGHSRVVSPGVEGDVHFVCEGFAHFLHAGKGKVAGLYERGYGGAVVVFAFFAEVIDEVREVHMA